MYQRIRDLREDKDMTQKQMAEILNCSQRIYSNKVEKKFYDKHSD